MSVNELHENSPNDEQCSHDEGEKPLAQHLKTNAADAARERNIDRLIYLAATVIFLTSVIWELVEGFQRDLGVNCGSLTSLECLREEIEGVCEIDNDDTRNSTSCLNADFFIIVFAWLFLSVFLIIPIALAIAWKAPCLCYQQPPSFALSDLKRTAQKVDRKHALYLLGSVLQICEGFLAVTFSIRVWKKTQAAAACSPLTTLIHQNTGQIREFVISMCKEYTADMCEFEDDPLGQTGGTCFAAVSVPNNFSTTVFVFAGITLGMSLGSGILIYIGTLLAAAFCPCTARYCSDSGGGKKRWADKCLTHPTLQKRWWQFFAVGSCHRFYLGCCSACLHGNATPAEKHIMEAENVAKKWEVCYDLFCSLPIFILRAYWIGGVRQGITPEAIEVYALVISALVILKFFVEEALHAYHHFHHGSHHPAATDLKEHLISSQPEHHDVYQANDSALSTADGDPALDLHGTEPAATTSDSHV